MRFQQHDGVVVDMVEIPAGLLRHLPISLLLGLAKPCPWEIFTNNTTTTVVV